MLRVGYCSVVLTCYGKKTLIIEILGCGGSIKINDEGAIVGNGIISKPAYPSSETSYAGCLWYIEKLNSAHTIVLNSLNGKSEFPITVI